MRKRFFKRRLLLVFLTVIALVFTSSCNNTNSISSPEKNEEIKIELNADYNLCLDSEYSSLSVTPLFFVNDEVAEQNYSYETDDLAVATVDGNGRLTALSAGATNLKVSCEYKEKTIKATAKVIVHEKVEESQVNTFKKDYLNLFGRVNVTGGRLKKLKVDHVASGFEVSFFGSELTVTASASAVIYCRYFIDGESKGTFQKTWPTSATYEVARGLEEGYHTVRFLKSSELDDGLLTIENIKTDGVFATPKARDLKIEFIGDSITAGYGALGNGADARSVANSDGTKSLGYLTAQKLNADYSVVALAGIAINVHMWRNDITMNELYKQLTLNDTTPYDFESWQPDVVVCLMGENSYGYCVNKDPSYLFRYQQDYMQFLQYIKSVRPNAKIVCVYGMMNYEVNIYNAIAQSATLMGEDVTYLLMKGDFNGAGYHPSQSAHEEYANILAEHIKSIL